MFYCGNCDQIFDEPRAGYDSEPLEHFGYPCRLHVSICPHCGSQDYAKAQLCEGCGEYADALILAEHAGHCKKCAQRIAKTFFDFCATLDANQKKVLNAISWEWDGDLFV